MEGCTGVCTHRGTPAGTRNVSFLRFLGKRLPGMTLLLSSVNARSGRSVFGQVGQCPGKIVSVRSIMSDSGQHCQIPAEISQLPAEISQFPAEIEDSGRSRGFRQKRDSGKRVLKQA